jgi:hypothetical protein
MKVKDFTPKQAREWAEQEAAKHTFATSRAARIAQEERFLKQMATHDIQMPNALKAHRLLIELLSKA